MAKAQGGNIVTAMVIGLAISAFITSLFYRSAQREKELRVRSAGHIGKQFNEMAIYMVAGLVRNCSLTASAGSPATMQPRGSLGPSYVVSPGGGLSIRTCDPRQLDAGELDAMYASTGSPPNVATCASSGRLLTSRLTFPVRAPTRVEVSALIDVKPFSAPNAAQVPVTSKAWITFPPPVVMATWKPLNPQNPKRQLIASGLSRYPWVEVSVRGSWYQCTDWLTPGGCIGGMEPWHNYAPKQVQWAWIKAGRPAIRTWGSWVSNPGNDEVWAMDEDCPGCYWNNCGTNAGNCATDGDFIEVQAKCD
jgi:hypothetical protein